MESYSVLVIFANAPPRDAYLGEHTPSAPPFPPLPCPTVPPKLHPEICDAILSLYDEPQPEQATILVNDVRDKPKQRITSNVSTPDSLDAAAAAAAGTAAGSTAISPPLPPPPPSATATSPRPAPSPRPSPSPSPSPRSKGEPSSSSSPSLRRTAAGVGGNDGTAGAAASSRQDDDTPGGGGQQDLRGSVGVGRGGEGEGRGSDGGHDKKVAARPTEEGGRRHHRSPHHRDPRDSPGGKGGGGTGREGKHSAKRKSGEGGADLEEGGREGRPPVVAGAVDTKRHKTAS